MQRPSTRRMTAKTAVRLACGIAGVACAALAIAVLALVVDGPPYQPERYVAGLDPVRLGMVVCFICAALFGLILAAAGTRSLLATRELSALSLLLFGAGFAVSAVAMLATFIWMPAVSGPMPLPEPIRVVLFLGIGLVVAAFLLPVGYSFVDAFTRRDLRAMGAILVLVFLALVVFAGRRA